ncbi:MAG: glutamine synthetase family protein [Alphaproteobacteria bacterium]|jgi:glutamine synthetase|nr:glutamine synthetase [Rhodospirillaceae bacterium]MDP6020594.1 glutamine synthetase family protein [Alphaproteobacteria bacterium]MDP6255165.1 glutamine synthetase family protein [Alphaproteobacteria bacterium]MDP7052585.1 glutamine synthetase family protein [Alphaproteobacteria bacterium]MDP7229702.1 glutamine synthetase family protein [Alphaproteobacteria bacterium]|tara:strand:+ start:1844 stop:3139 length:1296 start_codon:yes stop_codon:yes gene_type:complete
MNTNGVELPAGTHTVVLGVGDLNGIMRGKRIPTSHWPTVCENGVALSIAMFAIDMTCDVWDTPYVNFDNGYPDMHIFPDGPAYAIPWEEGVAFCFGRAEGMDHKAVPIDPRNALIRVLERASDMGYEVRIGAELEFYLLDPETLLPRDSGIQVYGLARAAELEHVLGPIRRHLNDVGIPIEQSNPEYAPGQVEVNIRYSEALAAADRAVAFRSLVKELAVAQDYVATFMSKPFFEQSGNGFHVHHSLWQDGNNVFADGGKLSALGLNYLAGLQSRMVEMSLASATTPNAYRRRQPFTFCPINTAWSVDNRTVGLRVIEGKDAAVRVEKRDGSADCNPYYLLACEIAAGLDGIAQGLRPTEPTPGNAYLSEDAEAIPTDLATALELARGSAFMAEVIGEDALGILTGQGERELEFFASQVTPVERERYLTSM